MKIKNIEIDSYDEIDSKTWLSLNKSYNSVKRQTNWPT